MQPGSGKVIGVFAGIGPAIGAVFTVLVLTVVTIVGSGTQFSPGILLGVLLFLVVGLLLGYVLGVIPAALTGLICAFVSPEVRSSGAWLGLCAAVGYGVVAILPGASTLLVSPSSADDLIVTLLITGLLWGLVGAVPSLVFAFLGPLVGVGIVLTIAFISILLSGHEGWAGTDMLAALGTMALVTLTGGLIVGSVPAALTGLICVLTSRRVRDDGQWLVLGAVVGLGVTFFLMLIVQLIFGRVGHHLPGEPDATLLGILFGSFAFALIGAASGLAGAAVTRRMRPR